MLLAGFEAGVAGPVVRAVDAPVGAVGVEVDEASVDEPARVAFTGGLGAGGVPGVPVGLGFGQEVVGGGDLPQQRRVCPPAVGVQVLGEAGVLLSGRPVHHLAQTLIQEPPRGQTAVLSAAAICVDPVCVPEQERIHAYLAGQP